MILIDHLERQTLVLLRGPRRVHQPARAPHRGVHQDLRQLPVQAQEEDHGLHRSGKFV